MNRVLLFLLLCILTFFFAELSKFFLSTNDLLYNTIAEKLTYEKADQIFAELRKWQYISYLLIPVLLLIKIHLIAIILSIGLFFFEKEIDYKKIWNIALKAEFIFLLVGVSKIIWFCFFQIDYTLEDIQNFYPLSVLNIIGYKGIDIWWIYPFQLLNIFEVAYWLFLSYLLGKELKTSSVIGLKIVVSSYGPALLIWVVTVMFFILNMS